MHQSLHLLTKLISKLKQVDGHSLQNSQITYVSCRRSLSATKSCIAIVATRPRLGKPRARSPHCSARGSSGPSTARSGLTLTWEGIYQSEDCLPTQRNSIAWSCKQRTTFTGTFFRRRWSSSGKYKLTSPVARCRPCTRLTVHMCKATDPRLCRQHSSLSRLDRLLSR